MLSGKFITKIEVNFKSKKVIFGMQEFDDEKRSHIDILPYETDFNDPALLYYNDYKDPITRTVGSFLNDLKKIGLITDFDWDARKLENEKTYTDGFCKHLDRMFAPNKEICRSCRTEWDWDGKSYTTNREPVKIDK